MKTYIDIDPEAKTKVELARIEKDANNQPYYIGKLQFPGTLEFDGGVSFMVFVSEQGVEELQIAPLDPMRLRGSRETSGTNINNGRFSISLHPMKDQNGKVYYIGEAIGFVEIDLRKGVFFTIFTSRPGQEELQITRLNFKKKLKYPQYQSHGHQTQQTHVHGGQRKNVWPPKMGDALV